MTEQHHSIPTPEQSTLFDLTGLKAIDVKGDNAAEFLQGQLSCDVREVNQHTIRQAVFCNLKGRILGLLDVIYLKNFKLILRADLLDDSINSLAKTAMLSRVSLQKDAEYRLYGLYANAADAHKWNLPVHQHEFNSGEDFSCWSAGDNYYFIISQQIPENLQSQPLSNYASWHRLQLARGRVEIYPQTRGLFLPHRLNLQESGHLNFNKGCYKGQEIIARTQFRATLKHRMQLITLQTDEPVRPGQKILDGQGQMETGELIDLAVIDGNRYLMAASMLLGHPSEVLFEGHSHPVTLL